MPWLPRPIPAQRTEAELQARMDAVPPLAGARIGAIVVDQTDRAVAEVRTPEGPAFLKWWRAEPNRAAAAALELDRVGPALRRRGHRVAASLGAWPDRGLLLLEAAPGRSVGKALKAADAEGRRALVARVADWAAAYADSDEDRIAPFGAGFWARRAEDVPPRPDLPAETQDLTAAMAAALRAAVPRLAGARVRQAAAHGDLTGANAFWDGEAVWGIDINGFCRIALASDLGRFLASVAFDDVPGPRRWGVPVSDWQAVAATSPLLPGEESAALPFFVGVWLHASVAWGGRASRPGQRLKAARGWLAEAGSIRA